MAKIPTKEYLEIHAERISLNRVPIGKIFYKIESGLVSKFELIERVAPQNQSLVKLLFGKYLGYPPGKELLMKKSEMVYYFPPSKNHP